MRSTLLATGVTLLTLVAFVSAAPAAPLTYTFSQAGWLGGSFGDSLSGSFTGTPEANGFILQGDLTAFAADFTLDGQFGSTTTETFGLADLSLFSFEPGAFDFAASIPSSSATLCSGAAAAFGLCGGAGDAFGTFTIPHVKIGALVITNDIEITPNPATVTLVPPTPVPGPASVSVLLIGLLGLGTARRRA